MPSVPYLVGGERPTAELMNKVYEALNSKLSKLLGGKSPALAFNPDTNATGILFGSAVPGELIGKTQFFTSGRSLFAHRLTSTDRPDNIDAEPRQNPFPHTQGTGGFTLAPYNHVPFLNAVNDLRPADNAPGVWDHTNHIVDYPRVPDSYYTAIRRPRIPHTSFWDYSLQAHKVRRVTPSDNVERDYWVRETGIEGTISSGIAGKQPPEKLYRYALAEIILEGPRNITIPATYDKYSCFRVHNLNRASASVRFQQTGVPDFILALPALGCGTVRRIPGGWEQGYTYFFKYRAGDYRHFWFYPTSWHQEALNPRNVPEKGQENVSNSMVANNLCNPTILFDWIAALRRTGGLFTTQTDLRSHAADPLYASWDLDENVVHDARGFYKDLFGDPANAGTSVGDLIHHKGDIIILKRHKTEKATIGGVQTDFPRVDSTTVKFNGYGTIVADFAAKNLAVTRLANGNLQIKKGASDPEWDYFLCPLSTNLFKRGELPLHPALRKVGTAAPEVIESEKNFFEDFVDTARPGGLQVSAPYLTPRVDVQLVANEMFWQSFGGDSATVQGPPMKRLLDRARGSTRSLANTGIDQITAADLLNLSFFGDGSQGSQNGAGVQYLGANLTLSEQGLVLRYREAMIAEHDSWPYPFFTSRFTPYRPFAPVFGGAEVIVNKAIKFRGHGWPYGEIGRRGVGFFSPRKGRFTYSNGYRNEVSGADGVDYSIGALGYSETAVKLLTRIDWGTLRNSTYQGRFWRNPAVDDIAEVVANYSSPNAAAWLAGAIDRLTNGERPAAGGQFVMALLPEQYNLMARYVNALATGQPLSYATARFYYRNLSGQLVLRSLEAQPYLYDNRGRVFPTPVDCFHCLRTRGGGFDDDARNFFQTFGVPLRTLAANMTDWNAHLNSQNTEQVITLTAQATGQPTVERESFTSPGEPSFAPYCVPPADPPDNPTCRLKVSAEIGISHREEVRNIDSPGTVHGVVSGNLATIYTGLQYVTITDVKALVASNIFGLPFNFSEVIEPLNLEVIEAPPNIEVAGSATVQSAMLDFGVIGEFGEWNPSGIIHQPEVTGPPVFTGKAPDVRVTGAAVDVGSHARRLRTLMFTRSRSGDPVNWKLPVNLFVLGQPCFVGDVHERATGNPFNFVTTLQSAALSGSVQSNEGWAMQVLCYSNPDYTGGSFSGGWFGVAPTDYVTVNVSAVEFRSFAAEPGQGNLHLRFTGGNAVHKRKLLDLLYGFTELGGSRYGFRNVALQQIRAGGANLATEVYLLPWHAWSAEEFDWWENDVRFLNRAGSNAWNVIMASGTGQAFGEGFEIECPDRPKIWHRLQMIEGLNFIEAPADASQPKGAVWRVMFDARGQVIQLEPGEGSGDGVGQEA